MNPSTLVLTACLQLNEELRDNDAFAGYNDDAEGTARLLAELWDIYNANGPVGQAELPEELVECWYNTFFADCNE